jgi:hypothetical protein
VAPKSQEGNAPKWAFVYVRMIVSFRTIRPFDVSILATDGGFP